jgi:hypothetical protein
MVRNLVHSGSIMTRRQFKSRTDWQVIFIQALNWSADPDADFAQRAFGSARITRFCRRLENLPASPASNQTHATAFSSSSTTTLEKYRNSPRRILIIHNNDYQ